MAAGAERTIERLNARLCGRGHRTEDRAFLWRSDFDEPGVLQDMALGLLNRVHRPGEPIYLIGDDSQTLKWTKKMDAAGKPYHLASGTYGTGQSILKPVCITAASRSPRRRPVAEPPKT